MNPSSNRLFLLCLFLITMISFSTVISCGGDDDDDDSAGDPADDDDDDDSTTDDDSVDDDDDDDDWQPVEPHKESYQGWTIVWYNGTPYEMGYQQGTLLHDELGAGIAWLQQYHLVDLLVPVANFLGLMDLAYDNSYQDIIDECQGMSDAAGDVGWSMEVCMLLNFGDVLVEFLSTGMPAAKALQPGCTQAAVAGDATKDGHLLHLRSLDWSYIEFMFDYPVIHVRQPSDGIPHVYIGFPGNLSPYNGMNAKGVSVASNEADPVDESVQDRVGRSHVQMVGQILKRAASLDEARTFVNEQDHMCTTGILVSDGANKTAAAFEMTADPIGIRDMDEGYVFLTNHFFAPETEDADDTEAGNSSHRRLDRLYQLISPEGEDTMYGELTPQKMISVLRDRINPWTGEEADPEAFDDNGSIASNGAVYQMVFDPDHLWFWAAGGDVPVPSMPFVGFSLGQLLNLPDAQPVEPTVIE